MSRVSRGVLVPDSQLQNIFSVVRFVLIVGDIVTRPYFVALNVPMTSTVVAAMWFTASLWTLDLVSAFNTGVYQGGAVV
eukprot:CAMPEP_0194542904 /NCGR_PEP_ID=MMETSP0253-20130528/84868_1 /TAXON_ID=2966 /ORGANISM="Noctiluca scintillans" /LENGTH=78 /DNA_ID=CAMNT_0039389593 /DNA_START=34 /DNA_END=267 /DNA_ORIENTATION=-